MKILKYDTLTGALVFNKEEYSWIPEFVELQKVCRKFKFNGDYRGDKGLKFHSELGIIWWCNDINSPGIRNGLTGEELRQEAITTFNLSGVIGKDDNGKEVEWTPTKEFIAAEKAFVKYNKSVAKDVYMELLAAMSNVGKFVKIMRSFIEEKLSTANLTDLSAEDMMTLKSMFDELRKFSTDLPKDIKALRDAEDLVDKELEREDNEARGKKRIPNSAQPDKAIS